MVRELNKIDGIRCENPGGAFYVFPSLDELVKTNKIHSAWDFCFDLLEKESIASVPGRSFGAENNIRFSYAISLERLKLAIQRMKKLLT